MNTFGLFRLMLGPQGHTNIGTPITVGEMSNPSCKIRFLFSFLLVLLPLICFKLQALVLRNRHQHFSLQLPLIQ